MNRESVTHPVSDKLNQTGLNDHLWNLYLSQILELAPLTRLVLDHIYQWMIFLNRDLRIVWTNQAAARALGKTPAQMEGCFCWQAWCQRDQPCHQCLPKMEAATTSPVEIEFQGTEGQQLSASVTSIQDEDGEVAGFAVIVRDITDAKLAGEEKNRREKLQGVLEMAGAAAHELSQPLQGLLGYCELLASEAQGDPAEAQRLQPILTQLGRLKKVVNQIQSITQYASVTYLGSSQMIDLERASSAKKIS